MTEPKYNEVYCKDCKHCTIIKEEREDLSEPLRLSFEGCPVMDWFESVWYVEDHFYIDGGYICDPDTLQPPPNCNCFEPRRDTPTCVGKSTVSILETVASFRHPHVCGEEYSTQLSGNSG